MESRFDTLCESILTEAKKSYSAKAARAGKKVAGAVLAKLRKK